MTLSESSIYIGLLKLRNKLYQAQFLMDKSSRIIYGTPLMEASGKTIAYFTLAYTVKEKRAEYLDEAIGWYSVLRNDITFCVSQNIIHYRKRIADNKESENTDEREYVSSQKIELFKIVSKIDEDMCRWRSSLAKGKTLCE